MGSSRPSNHRKLLRMIMLTLSVILPTKLQNLVKAMAIQSAISYRSFYSPNILETFVINLGFGVK